MNISELKRTINDYEALGLDVEKPPVDNPLELSILDREIIQETLIDLFGENIPMNLHLECYGAWKVSANI